MLLSIPLSLNFMTIILKYNMTTICQVHIVSFLILIFRLSLLNFHFGYTGQYTPADAAYIADIKHMIMASMWSGGHQRGLKVYIFEGTINAYVGSNMMKYLPKSSL